MYFFFGLGGIMETILLMMNGLAILNEKRVLEKYGWHKPTYDDENIKGFDLIKSKIILILYTMRKFGRIFLIFFNLCAIILKILFG